MRGRIRRPLVVRLALVAVGGILAAVALGSGALGGGSAEERSLPEAPDWRQEGDAGRDGRPSRPGLRAYLDPETGELRSRPVDAEIAADGDRLRWRLNTYGRDLLQERVPQGGFKVDLRGRFQSAVVATIDPLADEVRIDCVSASVDEAADER